MHDKLAEIFIFSDFKGQRFYIFLWRLLYYIPNKSEKNSCYFPREIGFSFKKYIAIFIYIARRLTAMKEKSINHVLPASFQI